ncbi:MAG: hypothetical protein CMJ78_23330 [Planctomycetaceae bacterium]|nr:hypothetical protein [Planctomycetaceae bacterium]
MIRQIVATACQSVRRVCNQHDSPNAEDGKNQEWLVLSTHHCSLKEIQKPLSTKDLHQKQS